MRMREDSSERGLLNRRGEKEEEEEEEDKEEKLDLRHEVAVYY